MSIEFENPLTAGTVLVREQIQSQNYDPGVSGWVIKANGDAEFNDVVIRGGTVVSGLALYYNGTPAAGNLILSIAAAAGVDEFGNAYPQGLSVYGEDGQLTADGARLTLTGSNGSEIALSTGGGDGQASIFLTPRDLTGTDWFDGSLATELGASNRPGTFINSPSADDNPVASRISLYGGGPTTSDTYILFGADRVNFNDLVQITGDLEIGGELDCSTIQSHTESVSSVGAVSAFTVAVTFPTAFPAGVTPAVTTNIATGSGTFLRWQCKAISITNTGFTLALNKGDAADAAATWTNQPVCWIARGHS